MVKTEFGNIRVKGYDEDYIVRMDFHSGFDNEQTYLCTLDQKNLNNLINELLKIQGDFIETRLKRKRIMASTSFSVIYNMMEQKYNHLPIMMARSTAFRHALQDGVIDKDTFDAAREYYGSLWDYVGD